MAAQLIPIPAALGVYPTLPEDFTVKRYVLPGTVERPEMEEAAARILYRSVLLGQWTGVSMAELYDELDEEKRTLVDNSRRLDADAKTLSRWKWAFTGYVIVAVVTVCFGLFFLRRPIRPASTVVPLPESGTFGQRGGGPLVTRRGRVGPRPPDEPRREVERAGGPLGHEDELVAVHRDRGRRRDRVVHRRRREQAGLDERALPQERALPVERPGLRPLRRHGRARSLGPRGDLAFVLDLPGRHAGPRPVRLPRPRPGPRPGGLH